LQGNETVLHIGAGSGYLTALLAQRCQQVLALEIVPELAQMAQSNLARVGIHNAQVRLADGSNASPSEAPFDAIVLSGSVAEVPAHLLNLLKVGGKLMAIVGQEPVMQTTLTTRVSQAQFSSKVLWDTCVPALSGFAQPSRFKF
jgi:protein-L-isoaspartate(D-aspartate) O-methyltransferase